MRNKNKKPAFGADSSEVAHSTETSELSSTLSITSQESLSSVVLVIPLRPWTAGDLHPSASGRQLRSQHYAPPTANILYH